MFAAFTNTNSGHAYEEGLIFLRAVGFVENQISEPTSPEQIRGLESRIVLKPEFIKGTLGLEPGQQILVVFYFHLSEGYELLQHPRGDQSKAKRGVFAIRSPNRPNQIGVTAADLLEINGNILRVRKARGYRPFESRMTLRVHHIKTNLVGLYYQQHR